VKQGLYDPAFERDACGVGFVVDIKGRKSHDLVQKGLQVLVNLTHRGATGCDPCTGDGAGILIQIPHAFFTKESAKLGIRLPGAGAYGVGMIFLPRDAEKRIACERIVAETVAAEGQILLGWRDVPRDVSKIGEMAAEVEPVIRQVFIGRGRNAGDAHAFERKLYVIRRLVERRIQALGDPELGAFHIPSLSARTIVYKGLLLAHQIRGYYEDLTDPTLTTALALVHQRYSTNTFPTWDLAHPYRYIAHNGEINTLRGNRNWMRARQAILRSDLLGDDLKKLFPILTETGSDSATFDNALEFLVLSGRSLPHAVMMLIPEAWEGNAAMDEDKRAFYEYHGCLTEPWDGPASIAFTDGVRIGAVLDRNGLRPSRYLVTRDDFVVMASETGVLPIEPEDVAHKGRLQPGRMFLIDTALGRIVDDAELKEDISTRRPYRQWVEANRVRLEDLGPAPPLFHSNPETLVQRQQVFGYTREDLRILMAPMASNGEEAIGSMGDDTALAALSNRPRMLFDYFKQLFAQVTNPAIDPIREELVMSLRSTLGTERNILDETPEHARLIALDHPILRNEDLEKLRALEGPTFASVTLPALFPVAEGEAGLERVLDRLCADAASAAREGKNLIILSDRAIGPETAPVPSLLALAAVHHHLIREGLRTRVGLIVETGEAREVAHFALLIGYGAGAVNPYLAFETLEHLIADGAYVPATFDREKAVANYIKAVKKGLLKIFSKMGISTLMSYRGAQIFEAIGLSRALVDRYFTKTPSRVNGIGLETIALEAAMRHERAFGGGARSNSESDLDSGGIYQWRRDGEAHMLNPASVAKLQHAVRRESYATYKEYSRLINEQSEQLCTLRGLFKPRLAENPIPLEEVEPASEIVKRFCTGAMSFGSISREAHETLAIAMNRIGGKSNTGEGGEDPVRFRPDPNGDSRRSAIKQVASGRFGVTSFYLVNSDEMQIKIAQGAKPGEGGQLPGHKVDKYVARIRYSTPGVGLISPPPHHDIYSIEDLAQLIYDLHCANDRAKVSVKLVSETGVGIIAAGVAKGKADGVLIAGHDGGTGASPQGSIKHAGAPWEIGLAETQQALVMNNLRGRIRVQVDGQLKTGRDVLIGALLGADEFGFSTAPLVATGCIMMRVCHLNTCPVGIATQDPALRRKFEGKPEHVINYFFYVAEEVRELMAQMGFRKLDDLIGRVDRLEVQAAIDHWKARGLDFSEILYDPPVPGTVARTCVEPQDHGTDKALDNELIRLAKDALAEMRPVEIEMPIRNIHRTVGTMLGAEISRRHGLEGLPENTIRCRFTGSAGQSFGAFIPNGLTMVLEGDANDYTGKGLSGGKLIVFPPRRSTFDPAENIIVGNVVLYGATGGEAFFNGLAGERFAVRNSGARAVVEGVGDHGCEYMTGGVVVVLGRTGRNFAAGMSGGVAYVLDEDDDFERSCNMAMVELERVRDPEDVETLRSLIDQHFRHTLSRRAEKILEKWQSKLPKFVKVMPVDYKRALAELAAERQKLEVGAPAAENATEGLARG
jgi:glutamate synthase domain-containing protein 2/glutamate synthase domain-containing protein 1/glutamate synthase domain-containing protein 3